jgi:hypothetical protein
MVLWLTMCVAGAGAVLALSLPIIETYARNHTTLEKS